MKILYVGGEAGEAHEVTAALRGIGRAVTVSWAPRLEEAAGWLDENRDVAALVVEARTDGHDWPSVLKDALGPGRHPAVVVIVPDGTLFEWLRPETDDYIPRNDSLLTDLPAVVTRAAAKALEQKLGHATAALQDVEQRHRAAVAAADQRLADQQAQYEIAMARSTAAWEMVDEQLRVAALEVGRARQDHASAAADRDRLSREVRELTSQIDEAAKQSAERQNEFDARLAQEAERCGGVEEQLAQTIGARDDAERQHASAAADVERLTTSERNLVTRLDEITSSRNDLERRLAATEAAFDDASTRATRERLAASKKAADREAELDGLIRRERERGDALEQRIAEANAALSDAEARHDAALSAAAGDLADRQARFDRELSQMVAERDLVAQRLGDAEGSLDQLRRDYDSTTADVERLTRREADLTSELADLQAARDALDDRLADAQRAMAEASELAASERAAAAGREENLEARLARETSTRVTLEEGLAAANAARHDAEQRHEAALSAAAGNLAERQACFERALAEMVADRDRVSHQLGDTEVTLEQLRRDHESTTAEVERLTRREIDLTSDLANGQAARDALDLQLSETRGAIAEAHEHAATERAAAATRQAEVEVRLAQESATCAAREQALADAKAARDTFERQLAEAATALRQSSARETELEGQIRQECATRTALEHAMADAGATLEQMRCDLGSTAADVERLTQREADLTAQISDVHAGRETLELQLTEAARALDDANERAVRDRTAADERERDLAARLAHQLATSTTLEQALADTRAAALGTERALRGEADILRARGLEQEAQFDIQLAQEQLEHENRLAEIQEANRKLARERNAIDESLTTARKESQRFQDALATTAKGLEEATRRAQILQADADQLPQLREQLDETRAENTRLFEQAGLAMFRCRPDGALIHANRACTTLVGRRTLDDVRGAQFAAAVFEAPDVLSWLIERCLSTRSKESIETTWRRNDDGRLFVRLSARLLAADTIEVVAEDLTRVRVLQERLGQAHRMEAVGRFAAEVAITCGNLLDDVHRNGQEWLASAGFDGGSRQQGELLLDEVKRAAGFLQQLAAFGDEQARTPMLVDLNTLVHDLAPVLRRVAGDDVEIEIGDSSSPLNVDVQTERVERLLVNFASHGRGRMALGGRLRIELGTIVVDRHFAAKHPNVRLGLHALITVTEIRAVRRADRASAGASSQKSSRRVPAKPGVDFATLHKLVTECGGHLWMKVHPVGEMVAKIRLPLVRPAARVSRAPRTSPRQITSA